MFKITAKVEGINDWIKWLDNFESTARDPRTMSAGVKHIGIGMRRQFKSEGGWAGENWRGLSDYTQLVRENRGYDPKHPILVQSGGLRSVTADALAAYLTETTSSVKSAPGARMAAYSMPLEFRASASGPKVDNHRGTKVMRGLMTNNPGQAVVPPRPFFGFTNTDADKAFQAIFERLIRAWARRSGRAKVV